jgi:hypothetical protein
MIEDAECEVFHDSLDYGVDIKFNPVGNLIVKTGTSEAYLFVDEERTKMSVTHTKVAYLAREAKPGRASSCHYAVRDARNKRFASTLQRVEFSYGIEQKLWAMTKYHHKTVPSHTDIMNSQHPILAVIVLLG